MLQYLASKRTDNMELKRNGRVLKFEPKRSQYLTFNGVLVLASDNSDSIWMAKQYVTSTLVILNLSYKKELGLWEDEEGYMHEVTEIETGMK